MAMKLHHAGMGPWQEIDRLSKTYTKKYIEDFSHQRDIQARIGYDKMLVRIEHRFVISAGELPIMPDDWWNFQACFHKGAHRSQQVSTGFGGFLACKLRQPHCGHCSGLKQRRYYLTEYEIDTMDMQGKFAVVVTTWQDLGSGLTPRDSMWISHFSFKTLDEGMRFKAGSIKAAFDQHRYEHEKRSAVRRQIQDGRIPERLDRTSTLLGA